MELKTQQFIESKLAKAEYRFDESVKEWAGWINGFPGIYAQADSIEKVRAQMGEMIEEYIFTNLQENKSIKGFAFGSPSKYAKAN